jgi:enterochelin esterase-like enzyme
VRIAQGQLDAATVERFVARQESPIVEDDRCTFLWRGEADQVHLVLRVLGLPDRIPLRRLRGTDRWYLVLELPTGSRVNYQVEVRRGAHVETGNDPLNPKVSYSPVGTSSVCFARGYATPDWTEPDPDARPGELVDIVVPSRALRRDCPVTLYLPARFRRTVAYPLLIVHDGGDFLRYAAAKTVLDNLIHRLDVADVVVAFLRPGDRLTEYANSAAHARFLTGELLPRLEAELPLVGRRSGRCLLGSSFGAVASLATAYRSPDTYGALALMSGSFVFTDIGGADHGEDPAFDPVVKFVNRYRQRPRRVADRLFVSCGVFEPLIGPNRSMVPTFESAGMTVRFVETRDGHGWENWRDSLRDALSWIYPG